jgi:hypothetical protein
VDELDGTLGSVELQARETGYEPLSARQRQLLEHKYRTVIQVNRELNRQLVSFQANKTVPCSRWFKYKEGFSEAMVAYLLQRFTKKPGRLLDPFAGAGSSLFAARARGWETTGIELLPVGLFAIRARLAAEGVAVGEFRKAIDRIKQGQWLDHSSENRGFKHVRITQGAFPADTEHHLQSYIAFCEDQFADESLSLLLRFAAFSVLESISYTRKDGQYLRWDGRSGRAFGSGGFHKGPILPFDGALYKQLDMMYQDMGTQTPDLFTQTCTPQRIPDMSLFQDSCLRRLREIEPRSFEFILTSPPYCNRYDYTRTYALELVFLGAGEETIKQLRQEMLSCTVENREKVESLRRFYEATNGLTIFNDAIHAFENQRGIHEVLGILENLRLQGSLNNPGIVRMVRNYFLEMSLVIHECARVMKPGAWFVMVNDNVSYNGQAVPVDLILSELASSAGLDVLDIWKLGTGKGNSSQQMGRHGRTELRKCVYVWRKPTARRATQRVLKSVVVT